LGNVCDQMQALVNYWEGLLHATGGALVPNKCFWYWIDFKPTNEKCVYITRKDQLGEMTTRDDTQRRVAIPRLDPHEARCTLGVRVAPDGNWETECQYLHSAAVDWQVRMAAHRLNPTDATFSLKNVVLRKLVYPLPTTTLTWQQCHRIMTPILHQGLSRAGVVRTYPWALVHGPLQYGGLDIPHLFTEQLLAHVHTILQFGPHCEDPTSFLLHATGEAMRLEVGYSGKLLAAPLCLKDNVTDSWLKHVWITTCESAITLLTDFANYDIPRQGDIKIMHLFINNGIKQPQLRTLNQCRLFLQVFWVSDIVVGGGDFICTQFWDPQEPAKSSFVWPWIQRPTPLEWTVWKQALTASLILEGTNALHVHLETGA